TVQEAYSRLSGKPILLSLATVRLMRQEADRSHYDSAKSERELALSFRPLEQTLDDTLSWIRANGL
ncbi:oxidoreductase, partial [Serratia marcescens]